MSERYWKSSLAKVLAAGTDERNAAAACESIASQFQLRYSIKGPPDLDLVARILNASIVRKPLQTAAWLTRSGDRYVVNVNNEAPKPQQNFATAHELAHIALYKTTGMTNALAHEVGSVRDDTEAGEVEALCDIFASQLLMPADEWANITAQFGISIPILTRLGKAYAVSRMATARRLVEVGAWRNAIILWKATDARYLEPSSFYGGKVFTDGSWPRRMSIEELMPADLRRGKAPRSVSTPELTLRLENAPRTVFAESGWLRSKTPLLSTIVLSEPHIVGLYQQFWSEEELGAISNADLITCKVRAARNGELFCK